MAAKPGPSITSVLPDPAEAGEAVTVTGTGFGATQGASEVRYDGSPLAVTTWTATQILAVLPDPKAPGTYDVQVVVGTTVSNIVPHTIDEAGEMAAIPAGCFDMGDHFNEGWSDELPVHEVCISAFEMDVYEVTNAQYAACVAAGGCTAPAYSSSYSRSSYYGNPAYSDFPVIYVNWFQATDYCTWAGKRLPTEAEWEYAARGGLEGKRYPLGDAITCDDACYGRYNSTRPCWNHCHNGECDNDTHPVGHYAPNGYGLYDMAGNVWEWVNDWYSSTYYQYCVDNGIINDPPGPVSGSFRVMRGGSWLNYDFDYLRTSSRHYGDLLDPASSYSNAGFRCSR